MVRLTCPALLTQSLCINVDIYVLQNPPGMLLCLVSPALGDLTRLHLRLATVCNYRIGSVKPRGVSVSHLL